MNEPLLSPYDSVISGKGHERTLSNLILMSLKT